MNFLLLLVAAIVEFTVVSFAGLRSREWSTDWAGWVSRVGGRYRWWDGVVGATVIVVLPLALIGFALAILGDISTVLGHAAALGVLLLMFGPTDLNAEIENHKRQLMVAGEVDPALKAMSYTRFGEGLDLGEPSGEADYDAQRHELAAIVVAAGSSWIQPLFWFFAAGPLGAVAYRLIANLRDHEILGDGVLGILTTLREALDWIPNRLSVIALGLAGTLVPALETSRAFGVMRWGASESLLARVSLAATDHGRVAHVISSDPRIYRMNLMHGLVKRTVNVWLVFLAIAALVL